MTPSDSEETNSEKPKPPQPQQSVIASDGSTIQDVIQAIISGNVQGDIVFGNKIYNRSNVDELNEYLDWAVTEFENRMSQFLR